jgi:ABC-2 type transport system permease protein
MINGEIIKSFLKRNVRLSVTVSLIMALIALLLTTIFPDMPESDAIKISSSWPQLMRDLFGDPIYGFTDIYGWMNLQIFHITFWMFLGIFAAILSSQIIAKEIEEKTIDIVLSCPVSRTGLIINRLAAIIIILVFAGLLTLLGNVMGLMILDVPVKFDLLITTYISGLLLCFAFASISLLISIWVPQQSYTVFITIGIMGAMFFSEELLVKLIPFFKAFSFINLFHFYRANEILIQGVISVKDLAILFGYFIILSFFSIFLFRKRDIPV